MSPASEPTAAVRHITYGSERINFHLTRRLRKTPAITVHPDLRVEVVAPLEADEAAILGRVQARARWILRQRRQFLSWMPKPMPRRYQSGETHRYLGRQYRLGIVGSETHEVLIQKGFLVIHQPVTSDTKTAKRQLDQWFRQQAEERFRKALISALKRIAHYQISTPILSLLRMPKR